MNDGEQVSSVNWKWFCILAGTVVMVGMATYFFLPSLISKTKTDVIIVKALEKPFKIKPTDPGGKIVDHQNLLIVDILKGSTKEADKIETLRPSAPNPEPPPVNVVMDTASETVGGIDKESIMSDAAQKGVAVTNATTTQSSKKENKQREKSAEKTPKTSTKATSADNKTVKGSPAKLVGSKKESAAKKKKRVVVIEGSAPLYMIQLAAFRNAKRAEEMAEILSQKHKSRLKDVDLKTMTVDNGSNGIFHRIVSVPLPREDADEVCSILRRSGQDCFLRKYETTTP